MISRRKFIQTSGMFGLGIGLLDFKGLSLVGDEPKTHPEIYMDGILQSRMFGRAALPGRYARYKIDQYKGAGINNYLTELEMANVIGWDGGNDYDYSLLDAHVHKIVKPHPDVKLILYVGLPGETPYLWNKMNEGELAQLQTGDKLSFASLGSKKWRDDSSEAMRQLAIHFENSEFNENILGYNTIWMANEWFGFTWHARSPDDPNDDFSRPMLEYFRDFLRTKYKDDRNRLKKAWNDPKVEFETANFPSLKERYQVGNNDLFSINEQIGYRVADYFQAVSEANADLAIAWGKGLKAGMTEKKLIGLMQGATHHGGGGVYQNRKQGALKKLLDAGVYDFHHTPPCYADTENVHYSMFAIDTVRLHNKIFFNQIDAKTYVSPHNEMAMETSGGRHPGYIAKDLNESLNLMKRDCGYALSKNVHCYWLEGGPGTMFPINPHGIEGAGVWSRLWYDQPELQEMIAQLKVLFDQNQRENTASVSEIALMTSNQSMYYRRADNSFAAIYQESLRNLILSRVGAPYDDYLLEDFPKFDQQYKVYIFTAPFYIDSALRSKIKEKLSREKATAIWLYAPGIWDENGFSLENLSDLTGMKMGVHQQEEVIEIKIHDNQDFVKSYQGEKTFGTETGPVKYDQRAWREWPSQKERYRFNPVFYVDDNSVQAMGTLKYINKTGLAYKDLGDYHSIFCAAPLNQVDLLRHLLVKSGVHIYNPEHDLVYANSGYMTLFALAGAGKRKIYFPAKVQVKEALSGSSMSSGKDFIEVDLKNRETIILNFEIMK